MTLIAYMLSYIMKIVLDTNILVAALRSEGGAARGVFRLALQEKIEPVVGAALYAEYEDVLSRKPPFERSILDQKDRETLFDALMSVSTWTKIHYLWRPNLRDADDDHIVELAVASGAKWIVTENIRDFQNGELIFDSFRIARARTFLEVWETRR